MAEQPATRSRWPGGEKLAFHPARGLVLGDMLLAAIIQTGAFFRTVD